MAKETLGAQRIKLLRDLRAKQRAAGAASLANGQVLLVPSKEHDEWLRTQKDEEDAKALLYAFDEKWGGQSAVRQDS